MKCEKCNKNEATFHYSENINGRRSERHLCADCAREEGFGGELEYGPGDLFGGMLSEMFSEFFAPARSLMSAFGSFGAPEGAIMGPQTEESGYGEAEPEIRETSERSIPIDAGEDVKARREIEALRAQLDEAVQAEDFEKAIELRDRIRGLEQ